MDPNNFNWMTARLHSLATTAWRHAPPVGDSAFVLSPAALPTVTDAASAAQALECLYQHARRWAPGLEAPFQRPTIRISPFIDAAGQYVVTERSISIELAPDVLRPPSAATTVLCHEACHHILDLSGLNTRDPQIDEPTTDLVMFVCGFGEVFLAGQSSIERIGEHWRTRHLGYLTRSSYEAAQNWVCDARGLAANRATRSSGIGRFIEWLFGGRAEQPATIQAPIVMPSETDWLTKELTSKLGGNAAAATRLVTAKRARMPGHSEAEIIREAIRELQRDRR